MRITFGSSQQQALEGIQRAQDLMARFNRQVSTGLRVGRPSDDPSASATVTVEHGALASFDHFSQANDSAESRLRVADSVLGDLVDKLTAARATVLSVRGTTATASQRAAVADEIRSLRQAVLEDFNASFRGTFLFGGSAGTVRPFTVGPSGAVSPYAGSTREVDVDIDRGRAVTVAFDGSTIAQGAAPTDVFAAFDAAAIAAVAADGPALDAADEALALAFDRAVAAQSRVGTSLRAVGDHRLRLAEQTRASRARVSALQDANLAQAISGLQQSETSYEAALGAAARTSRTSLFDFIR
jgi:flagellar hook-associated protein 3 FlgL